MLIGNEKKAIVLLSGGMDSAVCLALARSSGYACHALSFDYGQRHQRELEMAARQAVAQGVVEHKVIRVDLFALGGSALFGPLQICGGETSEIPPTYVPGRNLVFLSIGISWAEVLSCRELFIGANQVDYSGYPDCRRDFIEAFDRAANLGTRAGVQGSRIRVQAPLLDMSKAEIIRRGLELGVDFSSTLTCYDPDDSGRSCARCPACRLRLKGFSAALIDDPISYQRVD